MNIVKKNTAVFNLSASEVSDAYEGKVYEADDGNHYIVTDEDQIVSLGDGTIWSLSEVTAQAMRFRAVEAELIVR